jgi:hypothetical protein
MITTSISQSQTEVSAFEETKFSWHSPFSIRDRSLCVGVLLLLLMCFFVIKDFKHFPIGTKINRRPENAMKIPPARKVWS